MGKAIASLVVALASGAVGAAEIESLTPELAIGVAGLEQPLTEPRPAVSPTDPNHLVVGAILAPVADEDPWDCAALTSRDGGKQWSAQRFGVDRCIDPWVEFVTPTTVVFAGLQIRRDGEGDERLELFSARSSDGGSSWTTPSALGRGFEHPTMGLRRAGGRDELVLTARRTRLADNGHPRRTIVVMRSTDGGSSFEPVNEIWPSNAGLTNTGLALTPHGGIYVSFYDYQRNTGGFNEDGMLTGARGWGLYSADGGATFSVPLLIDAECGLGAPGSAFPGYPFLTAGGERLYHVCARGGLDGVALSFSDDGEAWSHPRRLDDAPEGAGFVLTPMVAAFERNVLVAWQDRRDDPECQYLYAAASADGGESFGPAERISGEKSCPATPQNGRAGRSWSNGGDYSSVVADANGRFHVVWADARSGRFRLYYRRLGIRPRN